MSASALLNGLVPNRLACFIFCSELNWPAVFAGSGSDLTSFAKIEQPPMAQMLARMERDGLIQRAPDPADGRSSHITLTEVAEARLPDAVAALLQGNHEVLRDFTDEEVGLLVDLLTRLIANLDRVTSRRSVARHANF